MTDVRKLKIKMKVCYTLTAQRVNKKRRHIKVEMVNTSVTGGLGGEGLCSLYPRPNKH